MNITTIPAIRSQITPLAGMKAGAAAAIPASAAQIPRQLKRQATAVPADISRRFSG